MPLSQSKLHALLSTFHSIPVSIEQSSLLESEFLPLIEQIGFCRPKVNDPRTAIPLHSPQSTTHTVTASSERQSIIQAKTGEMDMQASQVPFNLMEANFCRCSEPILLARLAMHILFSHVLLVVSLVAAVRGTASTHPLSKQTGNTQCYDLCSAGVHCIGRWSLDSNNDLLWILMVGGGGGGGS